MRPKAATPACPLYRYLTARDLLYLLAYSPKSLTFVRERTSRLCGNRDIDDKAFQEGYPLLRFALPTGKTGGRERIYCLSTTGRNIVESLGHPVSFYVKLAKLRVLSRSHLQHSLTLNRFVISLAAWAQSKPNLTIESRLAYELSKNPPVISTDYYDHEQQVQAVVQEVMRNPTLFTTAVQTAKTQGFSVFQTLQHMMKVAVIPDAIIVMTNLRTGQKMAMLLEIDANTEAKPRFIKHLLSLLSYVKSPHFTKTYGTLPYRIAYATYGLTPSASKARLQSLLAWTMDVLTQRKQQKDAAFLRFTTINFPTLYEDAEALFEKPVWRRPDVETPVPLLTG
jgi:hypothetical protein